MHRIFSLLAVAAAAALAAPAAASAACEDPSVRVSADAVTVTAPAAVSYTFSFCYETDGARYVVAVQERAAQPGSDGEYTWSTLPGSYREVELGHEPGQAAGAGSFTAQRPGRYRVVVDYYRDGAGAWEKHGEVVIRAYAPAGPPQPTDPVTPVAPAPEPRGDVALPVGEVAPVRAQLRLRKRAVRRTVRRGHIAAFRLTVRSVGNIAARGVQVCDRLPSRTQYVSASAPVRFRGAKACVTIGTLRAGASKTVTVRLLVDRTAKAGRLVNHAAATAANATTVKARASVRVPRAFTPRVKAPVTG